MAKFTKTLTLICAASALVLSANTASASYTYEQCKGVALAQAKTSYNTLRSRAASVTYAEQLARYYPVETRNMYITFYTSKSSIISAVRQKIHSKMQGRIALCKKYRR